MVTMTVSLPDPMKDWVEAQVRTGKYASTDEYLRDLIRRDRARGEQEMSLEDLREKIATSRASGIGVRTVDDIYAEAEQIAKARGLISE